MSWLDDEMRRAGITPDGSNRGIDLDQEMASVGIHPDSQEDEGFLSNLWKGLKAGGAGVYGGIADLIHADSVGDYMNDVVQSNRRTRDFDTVLDLDYWTDPSGAAYDIGNQLGSMAALAPAAIFPGGAVGGAVARFTPNLLGRMGLSRAATWAEGKAGEAALKTFGRGAATAVPESMAEGGMTRREALELGLDDPDARAWGVVAKNFPTLAISNGLEYALLGGKMFSPSAGVGESLVTRAAKAPFRAVPAAGANAIQNGIEELLQQTYQDQAVGREVGNVFNPYDWTDSQRQAFEVGAAGSAVIGGGSGVYHAMHERNEEAGSGGGTGGTSGGQPPINAGNAGIDPSADAEQIVNAALGGQQRTGRTNAPAGNPPVQPQEFAGGALDQAANEFLGKRMDNGQNGCVEAVTKIGAKTNSFLAEQLSKGVVYVPTLVENAGNRVIPFNASQLEKGDVIVYGDNDHVVLYDGNGGYYGNSSSQEKVVHGDDYTAMDNLAPTKIIKTGGQSAGGTAPAPQQRDGDTNAWAIYDVFRNAGYSDNAIAGILGRVQHEHGFDTSNVEEHWDTDAEGNKIWVGGYGMFQWNGGRTQAFLEWAQKNNLDPQDASVQAQYALMEAQQRGLTPDRMNNLSVEGAADLWTDEWEAGERGDERRYAAEWMNRIQNGGRPSAAPRSGADGTDAAQEVTAEDDSTGSLFEQFARQEMDSSDAARAEFFRNAFDEQGNFIDTQENQQTILDAYGEDFEKFLRRERKEAKAQKAPEAPKPQKAGKAPEAPQIETKTETLEEVRERLVSAKSRAADDGDKQLVNEINKALRTGDESSMREIAGRLTNTQPQNVLTAPQRGENANANQNTQTTTTTLQQAQESPTNQNQNAAPRQGTAQNEVTNPSKNTTTQATAPVLSGHDRAIRDAFAPIAGNAAGREQQVSAIRFLARQNGVTFSRGVLPALNAGAAPAIARAQQELRDAGISVPAGLGVDARANAPLPTGTPMQSLPQQSIPADEAGANSNVAPQTTRDSTPKMDRNNQQSKAVSYSDKNGGHRGSAKNGVITVWKSRDISKKDFHFDVTIDEIEKALKKHGNSKYAIRDLAKKKMLEATESWIENSPNERLKARRRDYWENDISVGKHSSSEEHAIDSAARVISNLYEKTTGRAPESWYEKAQREKTEKNQEDTKEKAASKATNEGGEKSAQKENVASGATTKEASKTASQNDAGEAKTETRKETPSEADKTSQAEPQEAREASEEKRGENARKAAKDENDTVKKEYKYYMNQRGVSPGAQPKGFTRFDEEDNGGRYGAIYYDRPLTEKEIADYELTSANQGGEKSAQNEGNKKSTSKHSESQGAFSIGKINGKHQAKLETQLGERYVAELGTIAKNLGGTANKGKKTFTFKDRESLDAFLEAANAYVSLADPDTMAKLSISAWHGSPHKFEGFSLDHIGTGEGWQAHGWGLYFARDRKTSEGYRERLAEQTYQVTVNGKTVDGYKPEDYNQDLGLTDNEDNAVWEYIHSGKDIDRAIQSVGKQLAYWEAQSKSEGQIAAVRDNKETLRILKGGITAEPIGNNGTLFQVEIPDEDVLLDEQKTFEEQPEKVRRGIRSLVDALSYGYKETLVDEVDEGKPESQLVDIIMGKIAGLKNGEKIYGFLTLAHHGKYDRTSKALNKHGIKGISYDGRQDGRCYVVFDDQAIDIIGKFSASGEIKKILAGIQIVNNEELNSQQRKISEIGEAMGVPVVWIDADSRLNGFHSKGVTFLNRKAGMSLQKTFWHEQFHWLRNNNDDLWRELLTYFKGKDAFSKKQIEAYQKKTGRYDLTSDEAVIEEMLADAFMDVSRRVPIMKELARDDRSLAQKLVAWIKDMMNRFVEMFHNPEGRLTTEQRDIFVEAFGKLARDMVDADGKKIFKVYDDGKTIRLADGSELAGVRLSTGRKKFSKRKKYSFAGVNAENAPLDRLERAKEMDGKANPDKIYEETGWFKGKDGKWRFELPDNLDQIDFSDFRDGATVTTLGKIYDNQALYDAYPRLKDIRVGIDSLSENQFGAYNPSSNMIVLNGNKIDAAQSDDDMKKTLVHEIQHAIQGIEGFAVGGSMRTARDQILGEIRRIVRDQDFGSSEGIEFASLNDAAARLANKDDSFDAWWQAMQDIHEFEKSVPKEKMDKIRRLVSMRKKLSQALDSRSDRYLYENLGGEQEAREVERRAVEGREGTPKPHDTAALIVFGGKEFAMSSENDVDNSENMGDNKNKETRISDQVTIHKDGSISIRLKYQPKPHETQRIRIERRKAEVRDIDAALVENGDRSAYVNLVPKRNKQAIDSAIARGVDPSDIAHNYRLRYNKELANYSDSIPEGKRIEMLLLLKGAELYATGKSGLHNDTGGSRGILGSSDNRNTGKSGEERTKENSITETTKHSSESASSMPKNKLTVSEKPSRTGNRKSTFFTVDSDLMDVSGHIPENGIPFIDNLWYKDEYATDPTDVSTVSPKVLRKGNATNHVLAVIDYLKDKGYDKFQIKTMSEYSEALMESMEEKGYVKALSKWRNEGDNVSYQILKTRRSKDSTAGTKFSINASDNSTPSLAHRIKNILAGTPATAQAREQYRRKMARMIEDALGVKIRTGKLDVGRPENGTVVYKEKDKVIRSLHAYDWENILPMASGLMAERLGIVGKAADTTAAMRNYISTWILTGAPNNTSAEAATFHRAMQEHPHFADRMLAIREQFQEWADKSTQEQMRGTVQWTKEKSSTWKERKNLLYEELVEELAPVEDMVKQYEQETGEKLEASINPMTAFRLLRGAHGRAITMIEGVGQAAVDGLKANFPNINFDGFKTLHTILDEIGALQNQEKQQDFAAYCIAKHILDMHRKNRQNRLEQEKLEYQVEGMREQVKEDTQKVKKMKERLALYQGEMAELRRLERRIESNKNKIREAEKRIESLKDSIYETPEAFTEENCEKYIRYGREEYDQAQKALVHFSNTTAAILADSGVISNKRYQELLQSWPNYVPLFRVFEENKDIDFGDSMKQIKGSMRDIVNPLESIVHNTVEFVKKAEKNKAKSLLADFARCDGTGWLIEEVDNNSPNTETVITFYENGQRKYLETDPSIVKAVNNMDRRNSNAVLKFLHAITSVARACFTMASPEFAFRNIFRDYADATVYNKFGFISPMDLARGFMHAFRRDNVYYEWLSSGAAQASAVSLDRNYTQEMIDKLGKTWKRRLASKQFFPALLEALQKASEYSEYATRIAMYEKAKQGLNKGKTRQDAMNALIGAAFESRDLMDFSRHGKAGAFWNKLVPFANASIQGMNKLYRTMDWRNGNKKQAVRAFVRLAMSSILPAMLLFLMNHDDDWFKELPDWVKETHWVFKVGDTIIRIPKGSDVGVRLLSNAVEKGMADAFTHDRVKATEYFMPLYDSLPNFLPIAILPLLEASLNRSTFTGRNIVPQYQEKFTPKMQYGPYTTGMAKFLGEKLGIAPSKIDHVIAGYTGSIGMAPWKFLDVLAGDRQLDTSITEMPLTRALTYMPYKNPKSVQKYYEELDEQTKLENEFKMTHKRPEGFNPALLQRLKDSKKQMSVLSKQERDLINNPNLTMDERKRRQFVIQQRRIRLVERIIK